MLYVIVEKFGPHSSESWESYIGWRKVSFSSFDSVDSLLRPILFEPESEEDWSNSVNEDFKINMITNLPYAMKALGRYENAEIVGVEIELEQEPITKDGLLGYDIIDGFCDISLLTNWGTDHELINSKLEPNGLITDFKSAFEIREHLRSQYSGDAHAESCEVWAIYAINT